MRAHPRSACAMGHAMPTYRLASINSATGRETFFNEFEAEDDAAAIRTVERGYGEPPMELWCGNRLVSRFAGVAEDGGHPVSSE